MNLSEVFNSEVTILDEDNGESACIIYFRVGGNEYVFEAGDDTWEDDPAPSWDVAFGLVQKDGTVNYHTTGTGNAFAVFGAVKRCCLRLLQLHPEIGQLVFTGDKSERSRIKLYDAMIRHIKIAGWQFRKEEGGGRDFYILTKI